MLRAFSPQHFEHYCKGQECSKSWEIFLSTFCIGAEDHSRKLRWHMRRTPARTHSEACFANFACGELTCRMGRNRLLGTWQDGEACRAGGDKDMRRTPRLAGRSLNGFSPSPQRGGDYGALQNLNRFLCHASFSLTHYVDAYGTHARAPRK